MVAMVGGNGFGLMNGSAGVLGQQGLFGGATLGAAKEGAYVNVFNGNLTLQNTDDFLAARGINVAFTRTYNAQGTFNDGNGANWLTGVARLTALPASPNTAGSTVTRIAADGSTSIFTYDASRNAYLSTDGAGAYQTLTYAGGQWTWKSGQTGSNGLYETYDQTTGRLSATGDQLGIRAKYYYNATGRLSQVTDSAGSTGKAGAQTSNTVNDQTYFDYDTSGNLTQIRQVLASSGGTTVRTHYEYDTQNRLSRVVTDLTPADAKITDNNVYAVSYTYDGTSNRIASVSQSDGTQLFFEYDEEGWVKKFTERATNQVDRVTTLAHTTLGDGTRQTSVTDGLNHTTTYYTDAKGQLLRVESPSQSIAFGYNAKGDVISTTDTLGRVTTFEYDTNGNCIRQTDPAGNVIERTYSAGNPASPATDAGNRLLTETVIAAGADRLTQSQTTRYVYEADAGITARLRFVVSPQGRVTEYTYDSLGQRSSEWTFNASAYAVGGLAPEQVPTEAQLVAWIATSAVDKAQITRTDYVYNIRGQATTSTTYVTATTTSVTATNAVVKNYTYDAAGNLLTVSGSATVSTTYSYDGLGRPLTKVDPNGTTTYNYLANSTTTRTVDPSGLTTDKVYDAAGRLVSVTQWENGLTSTMRNVYDAAGRLRMTVDAAGRKTVLLYDDAGRKVAEVGPDGAVTEYVYDAGNQPVNTIRYLTPIAQSALLSGDNPRDDVTLDAIRPAATAFDHKTWTQYDALGHVIATVDAERYLTRYVYDVNGHLVSTIQRAKQLTAAQLAGGIPAQAAAEASADDRITRALYNADGLLVAKLDALGYLTENVYDVGGRLVDTMAYANATAASARATGDLATLRPTVSTADIRNHFVYDNAGRLVASVDGDNYVTEVVYDANGDVQRRIRYATASTSPYGTTLAAVKSGTSASNADNRTTTYTYNTLKQVVTESITNGDSITYTYDKQGNVTKMVRTQGTTTLVEYDDFGRIVAERKGTSTTPGTTYTYNAAGQRTSMTDANGNRTLYFYDEAGRLTHTVNGLGEVTEQVYDAFGQVVAKGGYDTRIDASKLSQNSTTADLRDLLATAKAGARTLYYYDRNGRLIYTVDGTGTVTGQRYDAYGQTVGAVRYAGYLAREGLTGGVPDTALNKYVADAVNHPAQVTSYAYDANGHLKYAVNPAGEAQGYTYDAFGNTLTKVQYGQRTNGAPAAGTGDAVQSYRYDERGNAISYTDAAGNTVTTTYNAYGQVTARTATGAFVAGTTPLSGATTANSAAAASAATERTWYNNDGQVTATVDAAGTLTTYAYDGDGNVTQRYRYATALTAAAQANLASQTAATVTSLFTANTALDEDQRYFYDNQGRPIYMLTLAGGTTWTLQAKTYDAYGNVTETRTFSTAYTSTVSAAAIATWIATAANNKPLDAVVRSYYDAAGRLAGTATRVGTGNPDNWAVVRYEYDARGRLAGKTAYANPLLGANPTLADFVFVQGSASDAMERYSYDAAGRPLATAVAQSRVTIDGVDYVQWAMSSVYYDAQGNVFVSTSYATLVNTRAGTADSPFNTVFAGAGRSVYHYYDAANRLVRTMDGLGGVTAYKYDTRGNLIERIDYATPTETGSKTPAASPADRVTRTVYDLANRPVYQIDAAGAVTQRTYDALGNVTALTRYATTLDAAKLPSPAAVADVQALLVANATLDRAERYVYDQAGRLRFTVDAGGFITEQQYDGIGRPIRTIEYKVALTTSAASLVADVLTTAKANVGTARKTSNTYDAQGRLLVATDALGYTETYTYDALGRKLTYVNKANNKWTYEYDAAGRLLQETAPAVTMVVDAAAPNTSSTVALKTRMTYDAMGNVLSRTEAADTAKARTTRYTYDAVGRQIETILPSFDVYNPAADTNPSVNTRTETTANNLKITVTYNAFGDATSSTDVGGRTSYKVYDQLGRVQYDIDAAGYVTGYQRNAFGEVVTLTRYAKNVSVTGIPTQLAVTATADDRSIRTAYDQRGRVDEVREEVVTVYDQHALPGAGNMLIQAGKTTKNSYNTFGELIRQQLYGADASGKAVTDAASTRYYYDQRGQRIAQIQALADTTGTRQGYLTTYEYDYAGNVAIQREYANVLTTWSDTSYGTPAANAASDRRTDFKYDDRDQRLSETRVGVRYTTSDTFTDTTGNLTTTYTYDKVGNQTSVLDPLQGITYTYRDALGRIIGVAKKQAATVAGIDAGNAVLTEMRLDMHGNVVVRIEHAKAAGTPTVDAMPTVAADAADRITVTSYDALGHALWVLDPEQYTRAEASRSYINMSYDVYGRVAKQWRTVTDVAGQKMVTYQITEYDKLGHVSKVTTPGNFNVIDANNAGTYSKRFDYNAFGEQTAASMASDNGTPVQFQYTRYDKAGHAWMTNGTDGVDQVTLYDALGNATVQVRSTSKDQHALTQLTDASQALTLTETLRTDSRYDLLGHLVDNRLQDPMLTLLVRENGVWVRVQQKPGQVTDSSQLLIGDASDWGKTVTVQYSVDGGAWVTAPSNRVRWLDDNLAFNTIGLPSGALKYKVIVQAPGETAFVRETGTLQVTTVERSGLDRELVMLYMMLFNRAPDANGFYHWLNAYNDGLDTAQIIDAMMRAEEGKWQTSGLLAIRSVYQNAFGINPDDPTRANEIAAWANRYELAAPGDANTDDRAQVLVDLLHAVMSFGGPAAQLMKAKTDAVVNYMLAQHGTDQATADKLMAQAVTDPVGAIVNGTALAQDERVYTQIVQMYIAMFGRVPEASGVNDAFKTVKGPGGSIALVAEHFLKSEEGQHPTMYPSTGLSTDQYQRQLVTRMVNVMLGRAPSAAELAGWLARFAGSPALTPAGFAVELIATVTGYRGQDATAVADRNRFNNKVAIAYASAVMLKQEIAGSAGRAMLENVTAEANTQDAAAAAVKAATDVSLRVAKENAAGVAAAAAGSPLEEMQRKVTRLYVVLLGRAPDRKGLDYYLAKNPVTTLEWAGVARGFLEVGELSPALKGWPSMTDEQFVAQLYTSALGSYPDVARTEGQSYVQLLSGGASRAEVAFRIATSLLEQPGLPADQLGAKTLLNNKVAVAMTASATLGINDATILSTVLSKVTQNDVGAAVRYLSETMLTSMSSALQVTQAGAGAGATLADKAAATANSSVTAAAALAALSATPTANVRLQLVQMYVGLLGRDANVFKASPDLASINAYVANINNVPLPVVAQGFIDSPEGQKFFGNLTNTQFVTRVYEQILGSAAAVPPTMLNDWVAKLSGANAQTRGAVALGILNEMLAYHNGAPDAAAVALLNAKSAYVRKVYDAFVVLDAATVSEVKRLNDLAAPLKANAGALKQQLDPLAATYNTAEAARLAAVNAANSALTAAGQAGDANGTMRMQVTRLYATLLQRTSAPSLTEEVDYHVNKKIPLANIAQHMIISTEGQKLYGGLSDDAFVRKLYSTILGRAVDAGDDISYYTRIIQANTSGNGRGEVATMLLNAVMVYAENTPTQLAYKQSLDDKVGGFVSTMLASARTNADKAASTYSTASSLYNAITSAQSAKADADAAVAAAKQAWTDGSDLLNLSSRHSVIELYAAIRGEADYDGVIYQMREVSRGALTLDGLIGLLIDQPFYPLDNAAFVRQLYRTVCGNNSPTDADISWYVNQLTRTTDRKTRLDLVTEFMGVGVNYYTPLTNSIESSYVAKAKADVKTYTNALAAQTAAANAVKTAQTNYTNYGVTVDAARAASAAASNELTSMNAVVAASDAVRTADTRTSAATDAFLKYDPVLKQWAKADADYQAAATPLAQMTTAAATGQPITAALAAARDNATASVGLADARLNATPAARNSQQIVQTYYALLNRAPALGELQYWFARLSDGSADATEVVRTLMNSQEARDKGLYPLGNDAFVTQLYRFGLNRGFENDPTALTYWTDMFKQGLTQADVAIRFLAGTSLGNGKDAAYVNGRVATTLRTLAAGTATDTDLAAYAVLANATRRATAERYDAAAAAVIAGTPGAKNAIKITQLYALLYDRIPEASGVRYWLDALKASGGNFAAVAGLMINEAPEGKLLFPASLTDAAFVDTLFQRGVGDVPDQTLTSKYVAQLRTQSRAQVALNIIADLEAGGTDLTGNTNSFAFQNRVSAALQRMVQDTAEYADAQEKAVAAFAKFTTEIVQPHTLAAVPPVFGSAVTGSRDTGTGEPLYTVDRWGNVLSATDPRNPNWKISYTYNANNQVVDQTANMPVSTTAPFVVHTQTGYDALGRAIKSIDANSNINKKVYDTNGNVTQEVHADGGIVKSAYNLFGERVSLTQPASTPVTMLYNYDHLGNLIRSQYSGTFDVSVASEVSPLGLTIIGPKTTTGNVLADTYAYDELGRRIRTINGAGEETWQQYDYSGNVIGVRDNRGYWTSAAFDAFNHLIAKADGNWMRGTTPNDYVQRYEVDAYGRVLKQTDMSGATTTFTYDAAGQLLGKYTPRGDGTVQDIRYTYDKGRVTVIEDRATGLVTMYSYDAVGNRLTEQQLYRRADRPQRVQNNTIRYDMQNRVTKIYDDVYDISYEYDNNGNRVHVHTEYRTPTVNDDGVVKDVITKQDAWNSYDSMNRQLIVNGEFSTGGGIMIVNGLAISGTVKETANSHKLTYDLAGNRISDTFTGTALNASYGVVNGGKTVESYSYDAAGRLVTVKRDSLIIDSRTYDAAGRVTTSGFISGASKTVEDAAKAIGVTAEKRVFMYDKAGHMWRQQTAKLDGSVTSQIRFKEYDGAGNMTGYEQSTSAGQKGTYVVTYRRFDTYKEDKVTLLNGSTSTSTYDVNGNRTSVTVDGKTSNFWFDAEGHIQSREKDGKYEFSLIANGEVLGDETSTPDNFLGSTYMPASSGNAAPSVYSVGSNRETLQSIAQQLWGDSKLWYLIADANGLEADTPLEVGKILRIPPKINTVYNDANTFRTYNEADIIGNTAPALPQPSSKKGCGGVGQVLSAVVAIAVTVMTGGVAGAMLGSIIGQGVAIATGVQDHFSWKAVALAGVGGAVAGGVSALANAGVLPSFLGQQTWQAAAARAALSNTVTQGVAVATGLQEHFQWRNVAASAVGAGIGFAATEFLNGQNVVAQFFGDNALAKDTTSEFARGLGSAVARGGKIQVAQIARDAFGNALGNSIAQQSISSTSKQGAVRQPLLADAYMGEPGVISDVPTLGTMTYASARSVAQGMPLTEEQARILGADSEGRVVVSAKRSPSWFEENVVQPLEHALSETGHFIAEVGQAIGDGLNDLLVKPSGSTDEIPQNRLATPLPDYARGVAERILSEGRSSGPMLVPIDLRAEALARAQAQRTGNNLAMAVGGPFVAAPMLAARRLGGDETQVSQAGMLGLSAIETYSAALGGPRPPGAILAQGPAITFAENVGAAYRPVTRADAFLSDQARLQAAKVRADIYQSWKADNAASYASVEDQVAAYRRLISDESPWPDGFTPVNDTLPIGTRIRMAISPGQPATSPGGFATHDLIPDEAYVRKELAVKYGWKAEIGGVVEYGVKQDLPVRTGPVGPQIDLRANRYLSGGGTQVNFNIPRGASRMDYLEVINFTPF